MVRPLDSFRAARREFSVGAAGGDEIVNSNRPLVDIATGLAPPNPLASKRLSTFDVTQKAR